MSFNSRTRVGCDTKITQGSSPYRVSIHAPAWGAISFLPFSVCSMWFQFTHPRGVRSNFCTDNALVSDVSIHAPAWGAIILLLVVLQVFSVSIHAPAWGAMRANVTYTPTTFSFNSRTRVGCDQGFYKPMRDNLVSIHAPAWGAITHDIFYHNQVQVSIHAPAWGAIGVVGSVIDDP